MKYAPMLAKPFTEKIAVSPGMYIAQEKFDGHRILIHRYDGGFKTWSRAGNDSLRKLSPDMQAAIMQLPFCVLDGELIYEGRKHYDVTRITNMKDLRCVIFDVLEMDGESCTGKAQQVREQYLRTIFQWYPAAVGQIRLAESWPVNSRQDVMDCARAVWDRYGEGIIVKNTRAPYFPGKRSDAYLKLKLWQIGVGTITHFEESKGEINHRGSCAITHLEDDNGNPVALKTLNDELCEKIALNPEAYYGRRLVFEYTSRTPDNLYENPKWDRFEDE